MYSELPPERRIFIKVWIAALAMIYVVLGVIAVYVVETEKQTSGRNHALRMDARAVEPGKTPPDPIPATGNFINVKIGVYLEGIDNFSIKDSSWIATFYVWFSWKGDKELDPGRNMQIVDAKIERKDLLDNYHGEDGTNYQRFKVVARITKFFNTTRVPLDDHMLNIYLEDAARDASKLRYVADPAANISSRVNIPGYRITGTSSVVKPHTYRTSYGDPRSNGAKRTTFTEYTFAVTIKRTGVGVFIKLFIGLFAGVLLTIGSFFIRPSDTSPRFGLPSAAYFGAVANAYLVNSLLPSSGQFGLADLVTTIGLFTIFLSFVCSLTSAHFFLKTDEKALSRHLDRVSWIAIGIGFLIVNIAMPYSAFAAS